ncbi:MAG: PLDc N-terminal domain-containing protein [Elusimicrobiota bacterium]
MHFLVLSGVIICAMFVVYLVLILPVWMVISCVRAEEHSKAGKTAWCVFMALLWTPAAILYALSGSPRVGYRAIGAISGVSLLCLIAIFTLAAKRTLGYASVQANGFAGFMSENEVPGISDEQQRWVISALSELADEIDEPASLLSIRTTRLKFIDAALVTMLVRNVSDGQMSQQEYGDWANTFVIRDSFKAKLTK